MTKPQQMFNPAEFSSTIRPQDDLYRYVNGPWLDSYQIPPDRAVDGAFRTLADQALENLRTICEQGVSTRAEAGLDPQVLQHSRQLISRLYQSYFKTEQMDRAGLDPIQVFLDQIAGASSKEELAQVVGYLERNGLLSLVGVFVGADPNQPERYILQFHQTGLGLPDESYYREPQHAAIRSAYQTYLQELIELSGLTQVFNPGNLAPAPKAAALEGEAPLSAAPITTPTAALSVIPSATPSSTADLSPDSDTPSNPQAEQALSESWAQAVYQLEELLAQAHWDAVSVRDTQKTNNPAQLQHLVDIAGFNYLAWSKGLGIDQKWFKEETPIHLHTPEYPQQLGKLFVNLPLAQWKVFLAVQVLDSAAPYLMVKLQERRFAFYGTTLSGTPSRPEPWKRAVGLVEGEIGSVLGRLYVAEHFPAEYKEQMQTLTAQLLDSYREAITNLDWMSSPTKAKALEKLQLFVAKIGYPDQWRDYQQLSFAVDASILEMTTQVSCFDTDFHLSRILMPVDRSEWHMTPQTVNAYYSPVANEIVFPAAILQPPFFHPAASAAVNFGAIGAVIGHEIGHGFDDQGAQFDGHGKILQWWTDSDFEEFTSRTKSLIDQYDQYVPQELVAAQNSAATTAEQLDENAKLQDQPCPHPDTTSEKDADPKAEAVPEEDTAASLHVNGALTIGENIGDLGGLAIAFQAWKHRFIGENPDYSPELFKQEAQNFFFSWAYVWRTAIRPEAARQRLVIDPHSPAEFRCNGVVRNMDVFHQVFQTTPSDQLWLDPKERVKIWY